MNIITPEQKWENVNGRNFLINNDNKIIAPSLFRNKSLDELDVSSIEVPNVNQEKLQLVTALIASNSKGYKRLQEYLINLSNIISMGDEYPLEKEYFNKLLKFLSAYHPIDPKMGEYLKFYVQQNSQYLEQLALLIDSTTLPEKLPKVKKELQPKINIKKMGLYRYQFLQGDKLLLGDVENLPLLVNGYIDDEYSAVNRVLASQIGKLLGLHCEEVFFGYYHGKCVTLTLFHEAITLLENQSFELYELTSNYTYQSDQKRAFYYLIQNWIAYANVNGTLKERFDAHYIDSDGNIFMSNHQQAAFLTPQQMSENLSINLNIAQHNYRPIKDMSVRVGSGNIASICFNSIPQELIEKHDEIAYKTNRPSFTQKQQSFDSNWSNLIDMLHQFENNPQKVI